MDKTVIDKLVSGFRTAATELEELQVQLSLGKADARDKFEELKKKFNKSIHNAEQKARDFKEWTDEVRTKFDELRVQFALGKAETFETFNAQRKKIEQKMHDVELYIKAHPALLKVYESIVYEFDRIKIELEILAINYKLSKLKTDDSISKRREEMDKILKNLQASLEKHLRGEEPTRRENFRNEMKEAFHHLKLAITQ